MDKKKADEPESIQKNPPVRGGRTAGGSIISGESTHAPHDDYPPASAFVEGEEIQDHVDSEDIFSTLRDEDPGAPAPRGPLTIENPRLPEDEPAAQESQKGESAPPEPVTDGSEDVLERESKRSRVGPPSNEIDPDLNQIGF